MKKQDIIPSSKSLKLDDSFKEFNGAEQTTIIQVNGHYAICEKLVEYGDNNGILIRLCPSIQGSQGSTILGSSTGEMIGDTKWSKYWFIASARVEILPDPDSVTGGIYLASDGPQTTENGHQINSSLSVNAGFFGGTPTGGVAASSSFATTIGDFSVANSSAFQKGHLIHSYNLAATSAGAFDPKGGGVNWWTIINAWDLIFHGDSKGNLFSGIFGEPASPPQASYSNLPIASQGFWVVPTSWKGKTTFTIRISVLYLATHTNFAGPHVNHASFSHTIPFQIDWSGLGA